MSWDSYINNLTTKEIPGGVIENCVEHAAIISISDGSIWASTPNFGLYGYSVDVPTEDGLSTQPVLVNEIELLLYIVNHDGASNSLAGIRLSNEKYFKVQSDAAAGTIYLKKNNGGACIAKGIQTIVFGSWSSANPHQNPGLCNEQVEKLAEYLRSTGY
jgi:profilin